MTKSSIQTKATHDPLTESITIINNWRCSLTLTPTDVIPPDVVEVDLVAGMVIQLHLLANGLLGVLISGVDSPVVHVQDKHSLITEEISFVPIALGYIHT